MGKGRCVMKLAIYGAKSIALGAYCAIKELYPQLEVTSFLVTKPEEGVFMLGDIPIIGIYDFAKKCSNKNEYYILIGTSENMHGEIISIITKYGFSNYICLDSQKEEFLMEHYYKSKNKFPSIHEKRHILKVYQATYIGDKPLKNKYQLPNWISPLQIGAALTEEHFLKNLDTIGENISYKRENYNELVGLYWIWKNKVCLKDEIEYYGLFQYRRVLNISEEDILFLKVNDIDVVLPFPTIHEPDIKEHHARYIKESDWDAMLIALKELQPEYFQKYEKIFSQKYFYNYNLIIAKKEIFAKYCEWLFPILEKTERLVVPKGWERKDRFIGYLGENLMTLYFMYHQEEFKIYHTGRYMLT